MVVISAANGSPSQIIPDVEVIEVVALSFALTVTTSGAAVINSKGLSVVRI